MDTEKWKSVLVPKEIYEQIKKMSVREGRTISGQLRVMFKVVMDVNPPYNDNNKDKWANDLILNARRGIFIQRR